MALEIDVEKKCKGFHYRVKLKHDGSIIGLLGPSGAGKSMTLRFIAGLLKPDRGKIIIGGKTLFDSEKNIDLPPQQRRIGYVFQNYALFPHMTVRENIELGLEKKSKNKHAKIVKEIINLAKLQGLESRYPNQLSGGQKQRTALARSLVANPQVILLDEPFSALDSHLRGKMEQVLIDMLNHFSGETIFVSHNIEEAYRICSDLTILEGGSVVASGSKEEIFSNPPSKAAASIMGCKNFSSIKVLPDKSIAALDWGVRLNLAPEKCNSQFCYVGIYSHHIQLAEKEDLENVIECQLVKKIESPHYLNLVVIPNNGEIKSPNHIQFTIPKELISSDKYNLRNLSALKLYLPPEKIFLTAS